MSVLAVRVHCYTTSKQMAEDLPKEVPMTESMPVPSTSLVPGILNCTQFMMEHRPEMMSDAAVQGRVVTVLASTSSTA